MSLDTVPLLAGEESADHDCPVAYARMARSDTLLGPLPYDIHSVVTGYLSAKSLCSLAAVNHGLAPLGHDQAAWRNLTLPLLRHQDLTPLSLVASAATWAGAPDCSQPPSLRPCLSWRGLYAAFLASREVLVVDFGTGYTKFGRGLPCEDPVERLQLCSSPTHPPEAPHQRQPRGRLVRGGAGPALAPVQQRGQVGHGPHEQADAVKDGRGLQGRLQGRLQLRNGSVQAPLRPREHLVQLLAKRRDGLGHACLLGA
mmetsp:Transcript_47123/g.134483  ORF Transcript_47123/g.134483 Transcript_47123/m.134483 type:complete len:256 (+) Transcript_47123:40-807(+)